MKYPNLLDQFEMIMQHVQDENYPEATATVATFKMRLVDFEEELQKAREKVSEYQYANAHLHAEIGEFKEGLPIEKAKECGDYYCLDLGYCVATYFENGKWYYSDDGPNRNPCEVSNRLYPLPSTETQMEGE